MLVESKCDKCSLKLFFEIWWFYHPKKENIVKGYFLFLFFAFWWNFAPRKKKRCAKEKIKDSSLMKWYTFTRKCNVLTYAHCKQVLGSYTMFSKTKSVVPIFWKFKDKATCNSIFKGRCVSDLLSLAPNWRVKPKATIRA
jgi:hypothetical protein